jgi:epoxyqueuosine reductase
MNRTPPYTMLDSRIRELANAAGIDVIGFTDASSFADYAISNSKRKDPRSVLKDAQSIIVAGVYIGGLTLPVWTNPIYGRTSRLYLSGFFVDVVKPLEPIRSFLTDQGYKALICDSSDSEGSILPLKLAAIRAGLGWQGKHSLLISRKFGSFLALGGIITNAVLESNPMVEADHCGKCSKCQEACPVSALKRPYVLESKRCLSSLLQEEHVTEDALLKAENRILDCEICQEVCPWNNKHIEDPLPTAAVLSFDKEKWVKHFHLKRLLNLSYENYMNTFGHFNSGTSYPIFRRNVKAALRRAKAI